MGPFCVEFACFSLHVQVFLENLASLQIIKTLFGDFEIAPKVWMCVVDCLRVTLGFDLQVVYLSFA